MKKNNKFRKVILFGIGSMLIFSGTLSKEAIAEKTIKLIVDGKDITALASPIVENNRTLVPIRFISEELGAEVMWNGTDNTVRIEKGDQSILLRLESHLVEYNNGSSYELSDVVPKILNERTFVPLRLVSNALDIGINWNEINYSVDIDSTQKSDKISSSDVKIISINNGQVINGKTELQINFEKDLKDGKEVRFLLLDPKTAKGFIIGRGEELKDIYSWIPKLEDKGEKVLVAGIYDKKGQFIGGDSIAVNINIDPEVSINGLKEGQVIEEGVSIGSDINFVASYVKYEITNLNNGKVTLTNVQDPQGSFKWNPMVGDNGNYSIKTIAYDIDLKEYHSDAINIEVNISPKLFLIGVKDGQTIDRTVTLLASRNFNVNETEYLIEDVKTGVVTTIAKVPYGEHKWFPGPEFSGEKELWVRVKDSRGRTIESEKVKVNLEGDSKLILKGIGPNQVITEQTKLKVNSNVDLDGVNYIITNKKSGKKRTIAANLDPAVEGVYSPIQEDIGDITIQAEGIYGDKKILSEEISFRVYLDKTYGPKPIIEKDKFLGLASELAKKSREETGMSAALQTAQAILETGWGQSVPVDKYTGVLSNNLFGIKGQGPAGAVTSNTWEVYNGITYRVDADFRAYNDVNLSWADHKDFLLNRERYANFKSVMHDYNQGAWALKTSGYATDPEYAIKLMKIIKDYKLLELDKIGI